MRRLDGPLATSCALIAIVAGLWGARADAAPPWASDPVNVYYPRSDCRGEWVEIEIWDRVAERWRPHPGHRRVPLESCQLEDAGNLLHEIRVRCVEPPESQPPPTWVVGLDVFDPGVMETCGTQSVAGRAGDVELRVLEPHPGESVALPSLVVPILGVVRTGGIDGMNYDVSLVIDRSAETRQGDLDLLAQQVRAARAWLAELAPRLGTVRIGIVSYPNMPPRSDSDENTGARREVELTDDPDALERGLEELLVRGSSGFQTFGSALDFAEAELLGRSPGSGARYDARKLLVVVTNALDAPFARSGLEGARARAQLSERLERAHRGGIALELFAAGGLSEELTPDARELFEKSDMRFHRLLRPALETDFFSRIALPWVTGVVVENRTTGGGETPADVFADGHFRSSVAVLAGKNRLYARATLSDGARIEREWDFQFDDSIVKELILAGEREHMRLIREKRVEVRPQWETELPQGAATPPAE